jgi:hypothetical protein
MNSAKAAAREKLAAGEKGNVEHVALADDETRAVAAGGRAPGAKRARDASAAPRTPDASEKKPASYDGTSRKSTRARVEERAP